MAKTIPVFFRVNPEKAARIKARAKELGFDSDAEYLRRVVDADLDGATLAARVAELERLRDEIHERLERLEKATAQLLEVAVKRLIPE